MKLIGFWLLLLLAVLVPATATVAASMICPPVAVAKQSLMQAHGAQAKATKKHGVAKGASHARLEQAKLAPRKNASDGDEQAEHCCDASPCSHCASCGSCAAMAAVSEVDAQAHSLASSNLPEPGEPRAEFLLSGQERPPRSC